MYSISLYMIHAYMHEPTKQTRIRTIRPYYELVQACTIENQWKERIHVILWCTHSNITYWGNNTYSWHTICMKSQYETYIHGHDTSFILIIHGSSSVSPSITRSWYHNIHESYLGNTCITTFEVICRDSWNITLENFKYKTRDLFYIFNIFE